jgi:hypothetical protein
MDASRGHHNRRVARGNHSIAGQPLPGWPAAALTRTADVEAAHVPA